MTNIAVNGVLNVGPYKGYFGKAEYDRDSGRFHGTVIDTKDVITFVGNDPFSVANAFLASIDDYLEFCKSRGEAPDKTYSGQFVIRTTPKLHHDLSIRASVTGKSFNQYVVDTLASSTTAVMMTGPTFKRFAFEIPALMGISSGVSNYVPSTFPQREMPIALGGSRMDEIAPLIPLEFITGKRQKVRG